MIGRIRGRGFLVCAAEFSARHKVEVEYSCTTVLYRATRFQRNWHRGARHRDEEEFVSRHVVVVEVSWLVVVVVNAHFQDGFVQLRYVRKRAFFFCGCVGSSGGCGVAMTRLDSL